MAHLGDRLRQQRLAMGVSLQHISEHTRIGLRYLEALEAGEFKQLPGAIFARSFVRQYAELVGTEPASLEAELHQIFPSDEFLPPAETKTSTLTANLANITLLAANGPIWSRLPLTAISLTTALAVSSLLYIGWQQLVLRGETKDPVAQQKAEPPKPSSSNTPAIIADPPPTQTPTVVPAAAVVKEDAGPGPGSTVRIVATQETWISLFANGKQLFSAILQPHEERLVEGVETARMIVGNAGGVEVSTDGRSIGPIGPEGSVRVVLLSPGAPPQIVRQSEKPAEESLETPAVEETAGTKLD